MSDVADNQHALQIVLDHLYMNVGLDSRSEPAALKYLRNAAVREVDAKWMTSVNEMLEGIVAAEFYCGDYAAKEQPHAQATRVFGASPIIVDSAPRSRRRISVCVSSESIAKALGASPWSLFRIGLVAT